VLLPLWDPSNFRRKKHQKKDPMGERKTMILKKMVALEVYTGDSRKTIEKKFGLKENEGKETSQEKHTPFYAPIEGGERKKYGLKGVWNTVKQAGFDGNEGTSRLNEGRYKKEEASRPKDNQKKKRQKEGWC